MAGAQRRYGTVYMYDMDKGGGAGIWYFQSSPTEPNKLFKVFPDEDDRRRLKEVVSGHLIRGGFQIEDPMNPVFVSAPAGTGTENYLANFYALNFPRTNMRPINVTIVVAANQERSAAGAGAGSAAGAGAGTYPRATGARPAPADPCDKLLSGGNIVDKSSFRKWALENHPDKGGDQAKFQEMSDCYDKKLKPKFGGRRTTKRRRSKNKKHRTRRR